MKITNQNPTAVIFHRSPEPRSEALALASLLVAPSVTDDSGDCESIPLVIAEAQAMGLPVVSTYHGGIPEIVRNGRNGLLVPERSIHQLAQNILLILSQPDLQRGMGLAARENVCFNFKLSLQTARLEDFYLEAAREHARGQAGQ
jgi:colanic acid/amylovoran biosynthesis glycosyltransferase